ncbi:MAG: PDGLE domain-containing protein [Candidatus Zixiibacteriota bacterium]
MKRYTMRHLIWNGLLIALAIALILSPFASQSPDGLERVAEDKGFLEMGESSPTYQAPAPDYTIPGMKVEWVSTSIAGVLGTLLTFSFTYGIARALAWRKRKSPGC